MNRSKVLIDGDKEEVEETEHVLKRKNKRLVQNLHNQEDKFDFCSEEDEFPSFFDFQNMKKTNTSNYNKPLVNFNDSDSENEVPSFFANNIKLNNNSKAPKKKNKNSSLSSMNRLKLLFSLEQSIDTDMPIFSSIEEQKPRNKDKKNKKVKKTNK